MMLFFIALLLTPAAVAAPGATTQTDSTSELTITLLGTGSGPLPNIRQYGASILIDAGGRKFLFDCGRGATLRLTAAGVRLAEVDRVFLTHLHSDHVIGLPDLWLAGWSQGRSDSPLRVWGPEGTTSMMRHLEKAFEFDVHVRRDVDEKLPGKGVEVETHDIQSGVVFEEAGLQITAFEVDHEPVTPAFGYRLNFRGRSVTLSGDTRLSDNLVKHAMGTDVLIHEAVVPDLTRKRLTRFLGKVAVERVIEKHTTAEQAASVFSTVKPRLAVYSHVGNDHEYSEALISETRKKYAGRVHVGIDLMTIAVGDEIVVTWPRD